MTKLATLYGRTSKGKTKVWTISTEGDTIITTYGQLDGKMQTSRKTVKGKNIGKSNETTPEEQARSEAQSKWNKQKDKGYVEDLVTAATQEVFLPMLAKDFEKNQTKVSYPCFIQPKLDGVRCMAYWEGDKVMLLSRGGKEYDVPHIKEELEEKLPKDVVLDGEIYIHGVTFQEVTRAVKKYREESKLLQYHVYDSFKKDNKDADFQERIMLAAKTVDPIDCCELVITLSPRDEAEVRKFHSTFVVEGYEGAIVRNRKGPYKLKHRSSDLLKLKSFMDDEYKVVGFERGAGRFEECPIWVCETEDGSTFKVTPKGTMAERKAMLMNADIYLGKFLKVKYFELTEDGIPRFPIGEGFRMPEDM